MSEIDKKNLCPEAECAEMKPVEAWTLVVLFLLLLVGGAGMLLLGPAKDFSAQERRALAQMPAVSVQGIKDGTYMEKLETALADQFPGRNVLISANSLYLRALSKREIGGAYIGSEGYLFAKVTEKEVSSEAMNARFEALKAFAQMLSEEKVSFRLMLVPSAAYSLKTYVPKGADLYPQGAYLSQAAELFGEEFVDLREVLTEPEFYYRTDHHYTTEGAYEAYCAYAKSLGIDVDKKRRFQEVIVREDFRGTLYGKTLLPVAAKDMILAYAREQELTVTADGKELPGLYDETKIHDADGYAYFLGGNYGEVQIVREAKEDDEEARQKRRLLIIKDSFANCFVPLLTGAFEEIDLLDLRYYQGSVKEYLIRHRITDVLVLYGMDGFALDENVERVALGLSEHIDDPLLREPTNHGEGYFAKDLLEKILEAAEEGYDRTSFGEDLYIENFPNLYGTVLEPTIFSDGAIGYQNGNAGEISIIYVYDKANASAVKQMFTRRLERRTLEFSGYMPQELPKLEDARIVQSGHFVALIISEHADEVEEAFFRWCK